MGGVILPDYYCANQDIAVLGKWQICGSVEQTKPRRDPHVYHIYCQTSTKMNEERKVFSRNTTGTIRNLYGKT